LDISPINDGCFISWRGEHSSERNDEPYIISNRPLIKEKQEMRRHFMDLSSISMTDPESRSAPRAPDPMGIAFKKKGISM
jgi:hypothetical protein